MDIYNVLTKGVHNNFNPFAKAFKDKDDALKFCDTLVRLYSWTVMFTEWNNNETVGEIAVEDCMGNKYIFTIYKQIV